MPALSGESPKKLACGTLAWAVVATALALVACGKAPATGPTNHFATENLNTGVSSNKDLRGIGNDRFVFLSGIPAFGVTNRLELSVIYDGGNSSADAKLLFNLWEAGNPLFLAGGEVTRTASGDSCIFTVDSARTAPYVKGQPYIVTPCRLSLPVKGQLVNTQLEGTLSLTLGTTVGSKAGRVEYQLRHPSELALVPDDSADVEIRQGSGSPYFPIGIVPVEEFLITGAN